MDNTMLDRLEEVYGQELALVQGDLGQLESAVEGIVKSLGGGLLQRLVNQRPNGYRGSSMPCSCGAAMR